MDIEIVKTIEDGYRLWDGDQFLADCGKGVEGEERAKAVWDEIMNLQVANEELRADLDRARAILDDATIEHSGQTMVDRVRLLVARDRNHARMVVEHVRRRKEVEARLSALIAASERLLALDGGCDYVDGEPDVCPGEDGPCHWCGLRMAIREVRNDRT